MLFDSRTYETLWKRALNPDEGGGRVWGLRLLLPLFCLFFQGARALKHAIFRWGFFPTTRLPAFTLSIGNLTVGGAGKTPFAIWVTRFLSEELELDTVVLNRGFRSGNRKAVLPVCRKGKALLADPLEGGDECSLIVRSCPKASVVVGRVRAKTGRWACDTWSVDAVVLDDAFQYWRLARDLDVVVVNGITAFGNGRLFPLGELREPFEGLGRADLVVRSHADQGDGKTAAAIDALLDVHAPRARRATGRHVFRRLRGLGATTDDLEAGEGEGRPVLLVTCVAQPDSVPPLIREGGLEVVGRLLLNDHHRFDGEDWLRIEERARSLHAEGIVLTAKDEVNLSSAILSDASMPVWVLDVDACYEGVGFDLRGWLRETLLACPHSTSRGSVAPSSARP